MAMGFFTQGVCVLLSKVASLESVESQFDGYQVSRRGDVGQASKAFGGPTLVIPFRPEANGYLLVDVVPGPWPDSMGDPAAEPEIFSAWTFGAFGPFTYPQCLNRAAAQSWVWELGREIEDNHAAFIRVRCSYALGAKKDDPVMPVDCDHQQELAFLLEVIERVMQLPEAICYFNPNGEVLRGHDQLKASLRESASAALPPLDLVSNVRLYNGTDGWSLMDTVGNQQLDISDLEACFHSEAYDFNEIDRFLRDISLYLLKTKPSFSDGDTIDGPNNVHWRVQIREEGVCAPPRPTLRWFPQDGRPIPKSMQSKDVEAVDSHASHFWKDALDKCVANFGAAPRKFGIWENMSYMNIPRPSWLDAGDQLKTIYDNVKALYRDGRVVWGHVIQANGMLFRDGEHDCPGELVYSLTEGPQPNPQYLKDLAHQLFKLKGTKPTDPDLAPIADYLTDEMIRVFGLPVPTSLSPSLSCHISTTMFVRKHLPMKKLVTTLLPIVVSTNQPHVAMPLPEKYWADELLSWWKKRG